MRIEPKFLSLDVGEKRIGLALASLNPRIAIPSGVVLVDGNELTGLAKLVKDESVTDIVIGLPRNQSGEETAQTVFVREFAQKLAVLDVPIHWQDESLTSVIAEQRLLAEGKPYQKADIDSVAAALILDDFLETNHGHH